MSFLILTIHIAASILLILVVLLQQGKGADLGATFGGGGNTLFGASGADNILTKATTIIALIFMFTSVLLASKLRPAAGVGGSIIESLPETAPAPATSPMDPAAAVPATATPVTDATPSVVPNSNEVPNPGVPAATSGAAAKPVEAVPAAQ
jgi:preprotein translocase subunit SecG